MQLPRGLAWSLQAAAAWVQSGAASRPCCPMTCFSTWPTMHIGGKQKGSRHNHADAYDATCRRTRLDVQRCASPWILVAFKHLWCGFQSSPGAVRSSSGRSRIKLPAMCSPRTICDMPPPFFDNEESLQVYSRSASSTPCCGLSPNIVVIKLHTTVVIPNYELYYSAPIDAFEPPYHALADGSLVATPFISDVRDANLLLVLLSAAAAFFLINTLSCISFLRRGNIKNKILLYLLLASQVLGVPAMGVLLATYFDQFTNCSTISIVVKVCTGISHSLLITGILGYKAYRCLNNSRFVLATLSILRTTLIALLIVNLVKSNVPRRLSGSCFATGSTGIMPYVVIVQTVEAAFICGCFIYAVRKNHMYQGRISIQTSSDVLRGLKPMSGLGGVEFDVGGPRGWWDYVPSVSHIQQDSLGGQQRQSSFLHQPVIQFAGNQSSKSTRLSTQPASQNISRKTSTRTDTGPTISIRTPSVALSVGQALRQDLRTQTGYRPMSSASSVMSRLSKYLSRVQTFKKMLTDELYYTAFITVTFLAAAIIMLVGSRQRWLMTSLGWVCLDWIFISALTMHSFSRVVRRHEREEILQSAAAWNPGYRAEAKAGRISGRNRHANHPPSHVAGTQHRRERAMSDPFADFIPITPEPVIPVDPDFLPQEYGGNRTPTLDITPLPRSRQGSSSSTASSSTTSGVGVSLEVDLAAIPVHPSEQEYHEVENPFESMYEVT